MTILLLPHTAIHLFAEDATVWSLPVMPEIRSCIFSARAVNGQGIRAFSSMPIVVSRHNNLHTRQHRYRQEATMKWSTGEPGCIKKDTPAPWYHTGAKVPLRASNRSFYAQGVQWGVSFLLRLAPKKKNARC